MEKLFIAECGLLLVVLVLMPFYSWYVGKKTPCANKNLKGLNLPEGSIRAMLALIVVGSFILVLVLGPGIEGMKDYFDNVVTAFGTLGGAVIGFYFGNRGPAAHGAATSTSDTQST